MKFSSVFFLSFSILLLFANGISARKVAEDYWKEIMKDEPIPQAINGIIIDEEELPKKPLLSSEKKTFWSHFKKDFDVTSNVIIYHPQHQQNNQLPPYSTSPATSKPEFYGVDDKQKKRGESFVK